jgi:hypothetical protein
MTSHLPMGRGRKPLTHTLNALLEHDENFRQPVVHPEARGEHLIQQTTMPIAEALLLPIGEALARCTCDAQDEINHVFLIIDMGSAHFGSVNRARGLRRFSKREVRA